MGGEPADAAPVVRLHGLLRHRPRRWALAVVGAAAIGAGALAAAGGTAQPAPAITPVVAAPGPAARLLVFVSGAVVHPGLYEVAAGARLVDAIAAAGGLLASADLGRMPDLAGLAHDGHQVNVPFAKSGSAGVTIRVDANSASAAELEAIPGMSPELAQAIVSERSSWGPYAGLADLRAALGLDAATAALLGKHLRFLTAPA